MERVSQFDKPMETFIPDGDGMNRCKVTFTTELSKKNIIAGYFKGFFPWYEDLGLFHWFRIVPRLVLFPEKVKVSKSMRPYFNQKKFSLNIDKNFDEVIRRCATTRRQRRDEDTWITEDFIQAYSNLHRHGIAHSIEVYNGTEMVGGLYGLNLGNMFFGESMFSLESNASKFALICLCRFATSIGITCIDCQQDSPHMRSMGAELISEEDFDSLLDVASDYEEEVEHQSWSQLFQNKIEEVLYK